jgi:hypothetical protein
VRKILIGLAIATGAALLYAGSALWSVGSLLVAVRAGDGPAIVAQTDIARLRKSLVDQVVRAYLDRVGADNRRERQVVVAYGPTIADALIAKLLDQGLTRLLQKGVVQDPSTGTVRASFTPLAVLAPGEFVELVSRLHPVKLVEFELQVSPPGDPRLYTAALFRFEGLSWKLAGLVLPPVVAADIAAMLSEPAGRS